jgi:hypothetical protein
LAAARRRAPNGTAGEVLKQVAVVAGDLNDARLPPEPEAPCHRLGVSFSVGQPATRKGREVRVIGEDPGRAFELLELHEEALVTHPGVQWIEHLARIRLSGGITRSQAATGPRSTKVRFRAAPQARQEPAACS